MKVYVFDYDWIFHGTKTRIKKHELFKQSLKILISLYKRIFPRQIMFFEF